MVHPLFVLIWSETRSLFRALVMNAMEELPFVIIFLENSSAINKVVGKTVLRYCASIVGMYLFDLCRKMLAYNNSPENSNVSASLVPTRLQVVVSTIMLIALVVMLVTLQTS